jgi:hypothetical protein
LARGHLRSSGRVVDLLDSNLAYVEVTGCKQFFCYGTGSLELIMECRAAGNSEFEQSTGSSHDSTRVCPREVNGLDELPVLKRIVKRHPLGARLSKDRGKPSCERLVR